MIDIYNPTYADVHQLCVHIADTIKKQHLQFNVILGIARGGLVPAVILSHLLDTPLVSVSYSSKHGKGDNKNHHNTLPLLYDEHIFLIDEIADSGRTLKEIDSFYKPIPGNIVHSAVLYYKQHDQPIFVPTFIGVTIPDDGTFVNMPWEKPNV
ncbi:hypothetical protein M0R04_07350 [Candidatus Dojkabacteria bacterium]|nr:hypothetical protein [Candidatus Dojkabacteria bacterium]